MNDLVDCLIIGYGSIGARHANILKEMGYIACTLRQGIDVLELIHSAESASNKQEWTNMPNLELIS